MEIKFKKIILLFFLASLFLACDKFEMRGFFVSYESVNERFDQSMEWNKSHPYKNINIPQDDYSLYIMADSHVGSTINFDTFLSDAMKTNAAAVVMVGDLTTGHEKDFNTFKEHLPSEDSLNSFPIAGNHDLYFNGWKHFYELLGSSSYLFTITTPESSDIYICLDTGSGTLGSNQLEWLKNTLEKERPNFRRCVLFTHNNLFRIRRTGSTNPLVEEIYVLSELCLKHDVDMVITGHDHSRNVVTFGNTTHITMDALMDEYKESSYLKLIVQNGHIDYNFISM